MSDEVACPVCDSEEFFVVEGSGVYRCRECDEEFTPPRKRATKRKLRQIEDNRKRSRAQEKRNARRLKGRTTVGSGNTERDSGDVTTSEYGQRPAGLRVECKSTRQKGYRLTLSDLLKIQQECRDDEIPVFTVEFVTETGLKHSFYILPEGHALEMLRDHRGDD